MKFDEIPTSRRIAKMLEANEAKVKRQDRWDLNICLFSQISEHLNRFKSEIWYLHNLVVCPSHLNEDTKEILGELFMCLA